MAIVETRVPIKLGGQERVLIFNANTFVAYEEATGKFFLDTVASLLQVMKPLIDARRAKASAGVEDGEEKKPTPDVSPFDIIRKVSIKDLRALLWSAIHEYDENGEPHWPLSVFEVGRALNMADLPTLFTSFLAGQAANSPSKAEAGESPAAPAKLKAVNGAPPKEANDGGERSTELPQDAFDFVTPQ